MKIQRTEMILFCDFDGVLVDSVSIKYKCYISAAKNFWSGEKGEFESACSHIISASKSRFEIADGFRNFFIGFDTVFDEEVFLASYKRNLKNYYPKMTLNDSLIKIIKRIQFEKAFVLTAGSKAEIEVFFGKKINAVFEAIMDNRYSKDQWLTEFFSNYNYSASECFYIGDTEDDKELAGRFGLNFLGVWM